MSGPASSSTIAVGADRRVGRIGYGAMKLTGAQVWGPYPDHEAAIRVLQGVVDAGVTFIDTADVYGPHTNELLIKEALHPYPADLVIATKGGFVRGGYDYGTLGAVGNPLYLKQSAHMSARRLGVEAIDLYYLHSGQAVDAPFDDQIGALEDLRTAGVIRNIGLSNITLEQLRLAQTIAPIAAVTALYNITDRTGADLLAAAEADGMVFSPWHPVTLTDGPLVGRANDALASIAAAHGATPQQIALAWHLQHSPQSLPIPGTTSLAHLAENLGAGTLVLSETDIRAINDLASP